MLDVYSISHSPIFTALMVISGWTEGSRFAMTALHFSETYWPFAGDGTSWSRESSDAGVRSHRKSTRNGVEPVFPDSVIHADVVIPYFSEGSSFLRLFFCNDIV
jgi:hypothetical protein